MTDRVPPVTLVLGAVASVQIGGALAKTLFDDVGRSRIFSRAWSRAAVPFRRLRRRAVTAAQTLFSSFGKH